MARGVLVVTALAAALAIAAAHRQVPRHKNGFLIFDKDFHRARERAVKPRFNFNGIGPTFQSFLQFNERPRRRRRRFRPHKCRSWPRKTRTYDGFCNNRGRVNLGKAETVFKLMSPTSKDHKMNGDERPNPRVISNLVHDDDGKRGNHRLLSELVTFFGQFIDHVVTETENEKESAEIPVPVNDTVFKHGVIPFFRTRKEKDENGFYSPVNLLSSFIDASNVYGETEEKANPLRWKKGGKLRMGPGNTLPMDDKGFFTSGDRRANENPALTALHTLFFREHNRVCDELAQSFRFRNDEWLYHMARKIVGAEMQAIVYHEFLPAVMGRRLRYYTGYRPWVDPRVSNEFSTVGYRVGHTLINDHITAIKGGITTKVPLRDAFFQPKKFTELTLDGLIRGAIKTQAAEIDNKITGEVRNFLLGNPGGEIRLDLAALNIQRGRDHHVQSYNDMRKTYRLWPVKDFNEITSNADLAARLKKIFKTVDQVDAWTGGLCEDHAPRSSLGPLFLRIWRREFTRIRDGDRLYYESRRFFPRSLVSRVKTVRRLLHWRKGGIMQKIIVDNTDMTLADVKRNPFRV